MVAILLHSYILRKLLFFAYSLLPVIFNGNT